MGPPPTGFTTLYELHKVRERTLVNVIGRVKANPPGLISITDFSIREQYEPEFEVVAKYDSQPNQWHPDQEPQVGDVVVLTNFKKRTGYEKVNPMLYSARLMSKVVFYNQQMETYSKFPRTEPPPDYRPHDPIYKCASALIEDWKLDPRSGGNEVSQAAVQSYEMSLEKVSQKLDTSIFTTIKGKISALDADLFQLTDGLSWKVRLSGYKFEDEMAQRCRDEHSSYVQITHVRFKARDNSSHTLYAKMTDRTSITQLDDQKEKELLKARLEGGDVEKSKEKSNEKPQTPSSTPGTPSSPASPALPAIPSSPEFKTGRDGSDDGSDSETEHMGEHEVSDLVNDIFQSSGSSAMPKTPISHAKLGQTETAIVTETEPEPEMETPATVTTRNQPPPSGQPRSTAYGSPPASEAQPFSRELSSQLSQAQLGGTSPEPRSPSKQHMNRLREREDDSEPCLTVPHHIPVRKKIKSESPMARTPPRQASTQPFQTFATSQAQPTSRTHMTQPARMSHTPLQTQPQSQSPLFPQLGPTFSMSDYAVPEIEEPYTVVSGIVEDAGLTDSGHFSFTIYCECVDKRFLVKIRKEDERDFLGNCKNNQETKLKVLNSWASLQERVKVNLITDDEINERGEHEGWSVGNWLELQM